MHFAIKEENSDIQGCPSAEGHPCISEENAPAVFQLLMQDCLNGLAKYALAYIDYIIVFSSTFSDHLTHLNVVFSRLQSFGLT